MAGRHVSVDPVHVYYWRKSEVDEQGLPRVSWAQIREASWSGKRSLGCFDDTEDSVLGRQQM